MMFPSFSDLLVHHQISIARTEAPSSSQDSSVKFGKLSQRDVEKSNRDACQDAILSRQVTNKTDNYHFNLRMMYYCF